jgi:hypothetical protein
LSERPSKRTVDEPSFLAWSQTVATPTAAMSIAELITQPRPAGLSSGELLLGHGSLFPCWGRLFERSRPKWRGAWLSRLLHRHRSSPCSRPLALCPAGPLVLRAEVGRLPILVPYRQGESPSSAAEATTYAALSRRFRVPWNGHRTRCSRRGDRPFRNGERASRPSRA